MFALQNMADRCSSESELLDFKNWSAWKIANIFYLEYIVLYTYMNKIHKNGTCFVCCNTAGFTICEQVTWYN